MSTFLYIYLYICKQCCTTVSNKLCFHIRCFLFFVFLCFFGFCVCVCVIGWRDQALSAALLAAAISRRCFLESFSPILTSSPQSILTSVFCLGGAGLEGGLFLFFFFFFCGSWNCSPSTIWFAATRFVLPSEDFLGTSISMDVCLLGSSFLTYFEFFFCEREYSYTWG